MKLLQYFYKKASLPVFIISTLIFVMFMILVLPLVSNYTAEVTNETPAPDTSFFYSVDELYQMFEDYGPDGRESYVILRLTFDMLWPLAYTAFFVSAIGLLMKQREDRRLWLFMIPLLAIGLDYMENLIMSILVLSYPYRLTALATIGSGVSLLKWSFVMGSFALIVGYFMVYLIEKTKVRKS